MTTVDRMTLPPLIEQACLDIATHTVIALPDARASAQMLVDLFRAYTGEMPDSRYGQQWVVARLRWLASSPAVAQGVNVVDLVGGVVALLQLGNVRQIRDWSRRGPEFTGDEDAAINAKAPRP